MASIGTTLPSATAALTSDQTNASQTAASGTSKIANQTTFLQLLVAQLKNQDPAEPVKGTEFVTQLATFSNVEQNLAVRQDVDALSSKFLGTVPSGGTVAAGTATSSTARGG
jgi:flagellar basal-body rod modification protein FlgD